MNTLNVTSLWLSSEMLFHWIDNDFAYVYFTIHPQHTTISGSIFLYWFFEIILLFFAVYFVFDHNWSTIFDSGLNVSQTKISYTNFMFQFLFLISFFEILITFLNSLVVFLFAFQLKHGDNIDMICSSKHFITFIWTTFYASNTDFICLFVAQNFTFNQNRNKTHTIWLNLFHRDFVIRFV